MVEQLLGSADGQADGGLEVEPDGTLLSTTTDKIGLIAVLIDHSRQTPHLSLCRPGPDPAPIRPSTETGPAPPLATQARKI